MQRYISHSARPSPPHLDQLCPLQGWCGEQTAMQMCGGLALPGWVIHLECQVMDAEPAFILRSSSSAGPASMDFTLVDACL